MYSAICIQCDDYTGLGSMLFDPLLTKFCAKTILHFRFPLTLTFDL